MSRSLALIGLWWFLTTPFSHAYIPEYSLIASHAADQHGRGGFVIEQDVNYRHDNETFTVKETWWVANEHSLRVTLEGRGPLKGLVQGTMVYEDGSKHFVDGSGAHKQRLGDDWLEPLFHFRTSKYLRNRLVALKVAPPDSLKDRPPLNSEGDPKYEPPPFLRLSRIGGAPAWAIGAPPSSGTHPTLWVDQDQFNVVKYRGADQVVAKAFDYAKFDDGLWFPRSRSYSWTTAGGTPVQIDIQTLQVRSIGKVRVDDSRFHANQLNPSRDALKLPDNDVFREFYTRLR